MAIVFTLPKFEAVRLLGHAFPTVRDEPMGIEEHRSKSDSLWPEPFKPEIHQSIAFLDPHVFLPSIFLPPVPIRLNTTLRKTAIHHK